MGTVAALVFCFPILFCMLGESLIVVPCIVPLHPSLKPWVCCALWEPGRGTCALLTSCGLSPPLRSPCLLRFVVSHPAGRLWLQIERVPGWCQAQNRTRGVSGVPQPAM